MNQANLRSFYSVDYLLQDIVTRHLCEKNEKGNCAKSLNSSTWVASNSELTPSESLASTDDVSVEIQKLLAAFPVFQFAHIYACLVKYTRE